MPEIKVSKEMYERVVEFKQVVEAVLEEEISFDDCAALILKQGIDSMLADLIGPVDPTTLLNSFQQLGSKYPAQVYAYVAETLRRGAAVQERKRMKEIWGFRRPVGAESQPR